MSGAPRPAILDALGDELVRAAPADEARRAAGRGSRRPLRRLPRVAVIGLATLLLLAAVAVAATLVIGRGDPIPAPPPGAVPRELQPADGTARLNGLDVADPDGGPAWDVRTSRSRTGGAICLTVGQVLDGDLGIVGLDRRFHALPAGAADTCSTPQRTGATLAGARTFRGGDGLRAITVVSGVVAPGVTHATATTTTSANPINLKLSPQGAFLALFDGTPEALRPRIGLTEADGHVTTLRFADTGEYLTPDAGGGTPWTVYRSTRRVAPGLRCVGAQRERGPDSPRPVPRSAGSYAFTFTTTSTPPRCARAGTPFAAVRRFVPAAQTSWNDYYWGLNDARTVIWGAAARPGASVTVSAPGAAARRVAVDPKTLGYAAVLDGHVDPAAVEVVADGRPLKPNAGALDKRGRRLPAPKVPAWRSVASVLAALPAPPSWTHDAATVRTVARAADPTGGPAWSLRTWTGHIPPGQRIGKGMSRTMLCFQAGVVRDGRFTLPLPGGRTRASATDHLEDPCRLTAAGSVRVADPDGGAPWAAGTSRVGKKECTFISQVVGGHLAWVDQDAGAVRFTPGQFSSGAGISHRAPVSVQVQGPGLTPDAPGAPSAAQVVRRTLPGRTFVNGYAAPDVVSVTLRTPRDVRTVKPAGGSYLAVYDGTFYGGQVVATAHLRDGRDVTVRQAAAWLTPPGLATPLDRVEALHQRQQHGMRRDASAQHRGLDRHARHDDALVAREAVDGGLRAVGRRDARERRQAVEGLGQPGAGGELGLDRARAERGDRDAEVRQLGVQPLGEAQREGLARRVGRLAGDRLHRRRGGDDEDRPAALARDQLRDVGARQRDHRLAVQPHHVTLALHVQVGELPGRAVARVVDEDADLEAQRLDPPGERADRLGVDEVAGERLGAHAVRLAQLGGERLQAIGAAGDQHDAVPARGELPREVGADPRRGAGDQRGGGGRRCGKGHGGHSRVLRGTSP